jgi:diguanylate cyclase (GGDEF)-like protein
MSEDRLNDEAGRIAALRRYEILDADAEDAFLRVTKLVQMVLGVPFATLSLIDSHNEVFKSARGMTGEEAERRSAFGAHVIQGNEPLHIPDTRQDARFADHPLVQGEPYIRSYLGVPLTSPDGYNIGTLAAGDTRPRWFDEREQAILGDFAKLVTEQLELRQIGERDGLTGALTRRGFYHAVEREFVRASRYERPSSLLFLDIDQFKKINDAFGHAAGDEALRAVAAKCIEVSRQTDCFGRIGGQEFGFLLPETNGHEAVQCAERMREVIEKLRFKTSSGVLSVTASFGVASLSAAMGTAAQWFAETDVALYEAKRLGRNCCVLASAPRLSEVRQTGGGSLEAAAATIVH